MRENHDTSPRNPVARSKNRNLPVIEDSRSEKIPPKTPAEIREMPKVDREARGETKRRRRQELPDSYDAAPHGPAVDELLDNQIRHYCALQHYGIVPRQIKGKAGQREAPSSRDPDSEGSNQTLELDSAPRDGNLHPSSSMPLESSARSKRSKPHRGGKNMSTIRCMSTIRNSGSGVITKKCHAANKRVITDNQDALEMIFQRTLKSFSTLN
ncbi:hypothetical protein DSL72_001187 [Monilinia vaccinii-corymbosi]|uniref:Uncharacterized protein n=1 Tax=Monilinia vaccinii-corymbosi TaxID=61207 RepID=A0A8A3P4E1_9HELO|nr:hypothetical protein DSL72_001187 [Monilinia vaccinii-corymbosi]